MNAVTASLRTWGGWGLCVLAAGCAAGGNAVDGDPMASPQFELNPSRREALRGELDAFEEEAESLVVAAADTIIRSAIDTDVRRAALLWKTRMLDRMDDRLGDPNPVVAAVDAWVICLQLRYYLETGEGATLFGEDQGQAVQTARQIAAHIEAICRRYAGPAAEKLAAGVQVYAEQHPITGVFQEARPAAVRLDQSMFGGLQQVLAAPLAPFRAVEGVQSGAETFSRFEKTVADLPQEMRWQGELLLLTVEKNRLVRSTVRSLERISRSSAAFARLADDLPGTVEHAVRTTLAQVEASPTVGSAAASLDQISMSSERFADVAETLPQRLEQSVAASVQTTLSEADANASIQSALSSLEALARSSERFAAVAETLPAEMERRVAGSMHAGAAALPPLVDHVSLRIAQLLGLMFAGIAALLVLGRLLPRRRNAAGR